MTASTCSVYELRQYTLLPGVRDAFVDLFDREFVETQEAVGARVIGQYRDLDRPDAFVWIRGFADMTSRLKALEAFYGGPAWAAHARAANPMMLDTDNVLLLAPTGPGPSLEAGTAPRPPAGAGRSPGAGIVVADIYPADGADTTRLGEVYAEMIEPLVTKVGGEPLATLRTSGAVNTFPALPVREGEDLFVTVASFPDQQAHARHARDLAAELDRHPGRPLLGPSADPRAQTLRLAPTPRSALA